MSKGSESDPELDGDSWAQLELIIKRFESDWQQGSRPTLDDYLPPDPARRTSVLVELVATELELRLKNGKPARVEEYLERYPELGSDSNLVLDLIADEYELRRRSEPGLTVDEYLRRFPQYRTVLPSHLQSQPDSSDASKPPGRKGRTRQRRAQQTEQQEQQTAPYPPYEEAARWPTIPGYKVLRVLSQGGQGIVYQARELQLDRLVALKIIKAGGDTQPEDLIRFRRDAEAAAQLQHPHIVRIYGAAEHDGLPYFALEYMDGGSLSQRLAGAALPAREAAQLLQTLAHAMHYAHQCGIIHRDLKPANVLLQRLDHRDTKGDGKTEHSKESTDVDRQRPTESLAPCPPSSVSSLVICGESYLPKITDFGLAKRLGEQPGLTWTGQVMGTASYMAPEQAAGKSMEAGPAADVYGLGAILYETLTRRPPFEGKSWEIIPQVLDAEPTPPRRRNPAIDRDLETICLKCLQKEPSKRYATAGDLAADLGHWLAGRPILARPASRAERLWRWCRRNPLVASLAAAVVLVFLTGFAGVTSQWLRAESERRHAEDRELAARRYWYLWDISKAREAWDDGQITRMVFLLDRQRPRPGQEDLRGFDWYYLWRLCHGERLTLGGHTEPVGCVAFSPDGKTLATGSRDETVKVWDAVTGQEKATLRGHSRWVNGLAFSPDGKTLATAGGDGMVKVWDTATGKALATLKGHEGSATCVAFSPDGKLLASAGMDWTVRLWDAAGWQVRAVLKGHRSKVLCLAFSPDGKTLATGEWDHIVKLWEVNEARELTTLTGHTSAVSSVAFHPDDKTLATGSYDHTVRLWDVAARKELAILTGHQGDVHSVAFAADRKTLVSASADATVKLWDLATKQERAAFRGHTTAVYAVAFSADGTLLATASADRTARVWDARRGQEQEVIQCHEKAVVSVAVSPDGRTLASAGGKSAKPGMTIGEVRLWDTVTLQKLHVLRGHEQAINCMAFAPIGDMLATASDDGTVRVWEAATGRAVATLRGHEGEVTCVAFSPDGKLLASGSMDKTVKLWDTATWKEVDAWKGFIKEVLAVAFAPDGKTLAAGTSNWARTTIGEVRLWDMAARKEQRSLRGHERPVLALAFSPDGKQLATGSADTKVKLWDVATGRELATLTRHRTHVASVAFAPDGRTLAAAGGDVKLWDLATGEERLTLTRSPQRAFSIAFTPNGRRLVAGGDTGGADAEGIVILWEAATHELAGP